MKGYNISEAAKMLGFSSESLRNYERRGLITPSRGENGYRMYKYPDIYILSIMRFCRNAGYSLKEIKKFGEATYEECLALKGERCKSLEKEIAYQQLKLKALREDYEEFEALERGVSDIRRTICPGMLRVNIQINDSFLVEDTGVAQWVKHLPIVRISPAFSKDAIMYGWDEVRFGYAVPLELAAVLGLDAAPNAEVKPPVECLTTIVYSSGKNYLNARMLKDALAYCHEHDLELADEAWGITIGTHQAEGSVRRYHRIYIPISAKKCE